MEQMAPSARKDLRAIATENPPSRFLDYRHFFRHLRARMVEITGKYTYAQFSRDLGFKKEHVAYVLTNDLRRLSPHYLDTIAESLRLPVTERRYLRLLVDYTHEHDGNERQQLFARLVDARGGTNISPREQHELKFFTNWRHAAIFEMFEVSGFREDLDWIAARFAPPLPRLQVEESLALLQELGLIARNDAGVLVKTKAHVSASDSVAQLATAGFHMQMLAKARDALSEVSHDQREFGALTLALSPHHYERLREDLVLFRRYATHLSALSEGKDRVVQLNLQLFPLTSPLPDPPRDP